MEPSSGKRLIPGWLKAVVFVAALALVINYLTQLKSEQQARRRVQFQPMQLEWINGTRDRALQDAIERNDDKAVSDRLKQVPESDLRPDMVPRLAYDRKSGALEAFLKQGWDANGRDRKGKPLIVAIQSGEVEALRVLLEHGAEPDVRDAFGTPAIILAAGIQAKAVGLVKQLLTHKANPDMLLLRYQDLDAKTGKLVKPGYRYRALDLAVETKREDIAELLLKHGANPNATPGGRIPLLDRNLTVKTAKVLLEHGARPNVVGTLYETRQFGPHFVVRDQGESSPLLVAVQNGDIELVEILLKHGADPALATSNGVSPLNVATGAILERLKAHKAK